MFSIDSCGKTVIHSWRHHFWGFRKLQTLGTGPFLALTPSNFFFLLPHHKVSDFSHQALALATRISASLQAHSSAANQRLKPWAKYFPPLNCFHILAKHTQNQLYQWLVFNYWIHITLKQHKYFHLPQKWSSISSAMVWIYPKMPIMKLSPHCGNIKRWNHLRNDQWTSNKKDLVRTFLTSVPFPMRP